MRRGKSTTYGEKGGEGPTRGKTATTYIATLPDGTEVSKRDFNPPANPTGYAYQHDGEWYLAAIAEPADARFGHYTPCPARLR